MNKLIINNRTTLNDLEALEAVIEVVKLGRISNDAKQYCYGTVLHELNVMIWTDLNKKSDRFVITQKTK